MIQVNEYYEGAVKSMAADNKEGKFTVGVMEAGEYEFGTATIEIMTVVAGEMKVQLPGETEWKVYKPFESYRIEKDKSFKLIIEETCSYRCQYL
ncbi:MAG: hypothetical protein C0592_04835 [Marinilabiliales bacterium]|nr:MAG: hypothetical protein C0592_04835 [Marinilabiliales bacterium]